MLRFAGLLRKPQVYAAASGTQAASSPRKLDSDEKPLEDDVDDTLVLVDEKVADGKLKSYGHEQELQADTDVAETDHGKEVKASEQGMQDRGAPLRSAGRVGRVRRACAGAADAAKQSPWR